MSSQHELACDVGPDVREEYRPGGFMSVCTCGDSFHAETKVSAFKAWAKHRLDVADAMCEVERELRLPAYGRAR
jgi:hypothetical protein